LQHVANLKNLLEWCPLYFPHPSRDGLDFLKKKLNSFGYDQQIANLSNIVIISTKSRTTRNISLQLTLPSQGVEKFRRDQFVGKIASYWLIRVLTRFADNVTLEEEMHFNTSEFGKRKMAIHMGMPSWNCHVFLFDVMELSFFPPMLGNCHCLGGKIQFFNVGMTAGFVTKSCWSFRHLY
jgi:hypothetical protein